VASFLAARSSGESKELAVVSWIGINFIFTGYSDLEKNRQSIELQLHRSPRRFTIRLL
jgi:hypothetical protein